MESKPILRRPDGREENDVERAFDALERAATDPSLRRGSFWADALRDITVEGSSSEERFRARARSVELSRRNQYEFVEPTVIQIPCFSERPSEVAPTTETEDATCAVNPIVSAPTTEESERQFSAPSSNDAVEGAALSEKLAISATRARTFLRLALKGKAREDPDAERYRAKAQRVFDVGKALILAAFIFLAAMMIVLLLSGD